MPIIHENPTYFTEKCSVTIPRQIQQQERNGSSLFGRPTRPKLSSVTSYEDAEDGSELDNFLSSCESTNSSNNNGSFRKAKEKTAQMKTSSLSRLGLLFKSKSKQSISSGIGSPACTPDSSLSIYTNSLDGSQSSSHSSNSNQISPNNEMDRLCNDDCGIFQANMYYNVGESSVFTIYNGNRQKEDKKDDDEFEDCVQPYYNQTFSTFPNPKRCSVASAASTSVSSIIPVPLPIMERMSPPRVEHDRDGYLKPNEPPRNNYVNDSITPKQLKQVQVDVHNSSGESSAGARLAYYFDSASSSISAATTLVAGEGGTPVYMNRSYFHSGTLNEDKSDRVIGQTTSGDCEPYCFLCASSIMGSPRQRSKMDVAIVKCRECFFSREAESHIRGFFDKLMTEDRQKMDVNLKSYDLKDLDHPSDRVVVHCAKLQIVIISHHFLQRLKDEAALRPRLSPINRVFRSKNVIAILLAVSAQEVTDMYESVLPRFPEWFSVDLRSTNKSDPEFCKSFTEQVLKIYNVELSNSSNLSVFPKKVTRDQPRICISLKKGVNEMDQVRVELKTQREMKVVDNLKMDNPHTLMLKIPDSLSPDREAIVDVSVFVNGNKIGGSRIKSELNLRRMDDDDLERMSKLLPPFIDWLDKHISEVLLEHYKNCTDYTVDPALELMNGIIICKADILPTIMHFAAYYGLPKTAFTVLDEADGLAHCTVKNELEETPSDIAFARGNPQIGNMIGDYQEISNSYTAYRYIKELIDKKSIEPGALDELLSEVGEGIENDDGGDESTTINEVDEDDILEQNGSSSVSVLSSEGRSEEESEPKAPTPLQRRRNGKKPHRATYVNVHRKSEENPEYVQKRERPRIVMSRPTRESMMDAAKKRHSVMQNYDVPRSRDQEYAMPPSEVRPVTDPTGDANSPVFRRKHLNPVVTDSGYLIMNPEVLSRESSPIPEEEELESPPLSPAPRPREDMSPKPTPAERHFDTEPSTSASSGIHTNFKPPPSRATANVVLDPCDKQLIDLINSFKDKTYDIHMVELLFKSWQERPDVQKSIEEKMKTLDEWREEYRKTQTKSHGRKPSAFERIKSVLTLKRKKSIVNVVPPSEMVAPPDTPQSVTSPTGLSFTGPSIPQNIASPTAKNDSRISELSFRISVDSRESDSSAESDKVAVGESASSMTSPVPVPTMTSPAEYSNPMNKRFIQQYIHPNPNCVELPQISPASSSSSNPIDYDIPPPPRPVKGLKLPTEEYIPVVSPKPPRKPPLNLSSEVDPISPKLGKKPPLPTPPEEALISPKLPRKPPLPAPVEDMSGPKRKPPAVPAKPGKKYEEATFTPPPVPPPKPNASSNVFNFIDYKKKNDDLIPGAEGNSKKCYENFEESSSTRH